MIQEVSNMNEDKFNIDMRKFLKKVGINSQREIEKAVYAGLESGLLQGGETLAARVTVSVDTIDLQFEISGSIALD